MEPEKTAVAVTDKSEKPATTSISTAATTSKKKKREEMTKEEIEEADKITAEFKKNAKANAPTTKDAQMRKMVTQLQKEQSQRDKNFYHRKKQIVDGLCASGCDRSPKGFVDVKCHDIMDVLNPHPDYITTSSCSGRTALFHCGDGGAGYKGETEEGENNETKRGSGGSGWLVVTHDSLTGEEQSKILDYFPEQEGAPSKVPLPSTGIVCMKYEPFVMHVQCRTMDAAKALHTAATEAGFRNSGVVPGTKIIVAVRHAGLAMDAPVAIDGKVIATRSYVAALMDLCEKRLVENERRTALLEKTIAARCGGMEAERCTASEDATK